MKSPPMFLERSVAVEVAEALERVRVLVRRARRFTTKSESKPGITANVALHEAEKLAKQAIKRIGAS